MDSKKGNRDNAANIHETHISQVTGQVHTGSGDINVQRFSVGSSIDTPEQVLEVLRRFKAELEGARQAGLSEDMSDDVLTEFEAAEREASKDTPNAQRITDRLQNAKAILQASTGVALAGTAALDASGHLIAMIEAALQAIGKLF